MGGGGGRVRGVGQGGCERRIKVFVKIPKKYLFFCENSKKKFLGGGGGGSKGGCERRIKVFVKIQEINFGEGGSGGGGGGGGRGVGLKGGG